MSVLVTMAGVAVFLAVILGLAHFTPSFLKNLGGAPDAGADSAAGGSDGSGDGRAYSDLNLGGFDGCGAGGD